MMQRHRTLKALRKRTLTRLFTLKIIRPAGAWNELSCTRFTPFSPCI